MCGICGILNRDGAPVPRDVLNAMNATLVHRGPDQGAEIVEGICGLANRRLAILDLSLEGVAWAWVCKRFNLRVSGWNGFRVFIAGKTTANRHVIY